MDCDGMLAACCEHKRYFHLFYTKLCACEGYFFVVVEMLHLESAELNSIVTRSMHKSRALYAQVSNISTLNSCNMHKFCKLFSKIKHQEQIYT